MANQWFPVVTGLVGTVLGLAGATVTDLVKSRRDRDAEHQRWRRDRAMAVIEEALALVSAIRPGHHPDHDQWTADLARVNLLIRLYCGSNVQGAFSAIRGSVVLVANNPDKGTDKVMLALGDATHYLETTARHDLEIGGTEAEVREAQERYLAAIHSLSSTGSGESSKLR